MTGLNGAGNGTDRGIDRLSTTTVMGELTGRLAQFKLSGLELLILLIIRAHARDGLGHAFPRRETLAKEAMCTERSASRATARLERLGLIRKDWRRSQGGRTFYELVDEQVTKSSPAGDQIVTSRCPNGHPQVTRLSLTTKEKEDLERTPPSGGERAREGEVFSSEVDRRQVELLLPIDGGGNRMAPLKRFNPSDATVEWAAEHYGINAREERILGEFIDYHLEHNKLPADIDAAYRRWIRRQSRFDNRDAERSRDRRQHSTPEVNAAFDDALSQMRAHGARQ
jgi:DNA-binding MarR family transcriptional regulator